MFTLKVGTATAKRKRILVAEAIAISILIAVLMLTGNVQSIIDPQKYVHNYLNDPEMGNWTYVEKPMYPVYFSNSQIGIGSNWSIVCPLEAGHSYHVYCYGAWVNTGTAPKTDYDIYVYNPEGKLESMHTEAAGLPEHLGTTVDDPFFEPAKSGNYTFVIVNDARESKGAQQATFMVIEHIECNKWYRRTIEGKNGSRPVFGTSWAYEFITAAPLIEVWVKVPDTLDMYEARIYLMNKKPSVYINNVPLPWEMGLYGNLSGSIGGYNLESEGYRGVAYASCEYNGQDMFLNYTPTAVTEPNVYHLVLMGEAGSGTVEFLVKTTFSGNLSALTSPRRVYPDNETVIAYEASKAALESATLKFTTNRWANTTSIQMTVNNMTCNATIPRQEAGTLVEYVVQAVDTLKNNLTATGNFTVKYAAAIVDFNATRKTILLGENITVTGILQPPAANNMITVQFMSANETKLVQCSTFENGTFTATFQPKTSGVWVAKATFAGSTTTYECESELLIISVEEPSFLAANGLFIGAGAGSAAVAAGIVVYFKKFRQ
ncbi:MAG: hypothetical protein QXU99_05985 [Candidatus Bathyarchaeia archaeon]